MRTIGIMPASFNPPTVAHLELMRAALDHVDEIICVLPRVFPHKEYFGATLDERLEMVRLATSGLACSVEVTEQGLFLDIARECRAQLGGPVRLLFLCGADAAERIVNWDYGRPGVAEEMLREFELLVAPRGADYRPPAHLGDRIHALQISAEAQTVSSTQVRERIRRGEGWEHLVPAAIVDKVRAIYS